MSANDPTKGNEKPPVKSQAASINALNKKAENLNLDGGKLQAPRELTPANKLVAEIKGIKDRGNLTPEEKQILQNKMAELNKINPELLNSFKAKKAEPDQMSRVKNVKGKVPRVKSEKAKPHKHGGPH